MKHYTDDHHGDRIFDVTSLNPYTIKMQLTIMPALYNWQLFCETLLSLNYFFIYNSFQYYICASSVKIFLLIQRTGQTMCRFSLNIFIGPEDRTDKAIL